MKIFAGYPGQNKNFQCGGIRIVVTVVSGINAPSISPNSTMNPMRVIKQIVSPICLNLFLTLITSQNL